jgi:hypothetical protein
MHSSDCASLWGAHQRIRFPGRSRCPADRVAARVARFGSCACTIDLGSYYLARLRRDAGRRQSNLVLARCVVALPSISDLRSCPHVCGPPGTTPALIDIQPHLSTEEHLRSPQPIAGAPASCSESSDPGFPAHPRSIRAGSSI